MTMTREQIEEIRWDLEHFIAIFPITTSDLNALLDAADRAVRLEEALRNLVKKNEEWNQAVIEVVGRPPNWTDEYLNEARHALAGGEGEG